MVKSPKHRGNATHLHCNRCGEVFPLSSFRPIGRLCKDCLKVRKKEYEASPRGKATINAYRGKWRSKNRIKLRSSARSYYSKHKDEATSRSIARRVLIKNGQVEKFSRRQIFERDQGKCFYCAKELDQKKWHLDHVIPVIKGGPHIELNVVASCVDCNQKKGTNPCLVPGKTPLKFLLYRTEDLSGVSGDGYVAEGAMFGNGKVAVCWRGETSSINIYDSIFDCEQVHGHNGATEIVYEG